MNNKMIHAIWAITLFIVIVVVLVNVSLIDWHSLIKNLLF